MEIFDFKIQFGTTVMLISTACFEHNTQILLVRQPNSSQLQIRSKSFKDILVRFNVSQTCVYILRFNWLVGFYLFMSLVCNARFLILKNSCVREELIDLPFFLQTQLFLRIRNLALQTNDIKRQRHINQFNPSIRTFDYLKPEMPHFHHHI